MSFATTSTAATAWNGPICGTCGARYMDSHTCSDDDILRRVWELLNLIDRRAASLKSPTQSCPCRPENGGSGVCGCILGGPRITC